MSTTMNKVIEYVDRVKPNVYTDVDKYKWMKLLEDKIICEVMGGKGAVCSIPKDTDVELSVKSPYDEIYELYVMAMIDFHNKEYDDYNNTILRFREVYDQFVAWYIQHNGGGGAKNFRNVMG